MLEGGLRILKLSVKNIQVHIKIFLVDLGEMDESVMVGNSIKSDAVPAVKAGAWGIHVPYPITWELEMARTND
jgi:putative hydrolase of the HAD superfamily